MSDLENEIIQIRERFRSDPKLAACHHFSYDFRLGDFDKARFIVMGMNPGETDDDRGHPGFAEESSLVDYRSGIDSVGRKRWFDTCRTILGTDQIALTEFIFWSSPNVPILRSRLGELGPYLSWCRDLNVRLFEHHAPAAIIAPGLGLMREGVDLYGLKHVRSVRTPKGHRLIEHWAQDGLPWIFTKHWSGAFGFSGNQRRQISDYVASL